MNLEELEEELSNILPVGFHISSDKNGQVIIFTNLSSDDDGELYDFESDEDEDELELDGALPLADDEDDEDNDYD